MHDVEGSFRSHGCNRITARWMNQGQMTYRGSDSLANAMTYSILTGVYAAELKGPRSNEA